MKKVLIAGIVIAIVFVVAGVIAEDKIPLEVKIQAVEGDVEVKSPSGAWNKAAVGKTLKEGDMISTGFGAKAELIMADNSAVIVYQLTQLKIDSFFKEKTKVKTDLNLKIGKVRAQVQKVGDQISDFSVVTPTSVVSVRGTGMDVGESDKGTNVQTLVHSVQVQDNRGRTEIVQSGQTSNVAPGEVPTQSVVESMNNAKVNTSTAGLTGEEVKGRQTVDIPEVKPGDPGKGGSVG